MRQHGAQPLLDEIGKAEPLVDAYVASLTGTRLDAVGRRTEAAKNVARLLKSVQNPFEREALLRLAAYRLGREVLLDAESAPAASVPSSNAPAGDHAPSAEERLVELMALDPAVVERVQASGVIAEFTPEWRRVAEGIAGVTDAESSRAALENLPRDVRDRIVRRLFEDDPGERERVLADCITKIQARRGGRTRSAILESLRAAEARGDVAAARALEDELNRFLSEKNRT